MVMFRGISSYFSIWSIRGLALKRFLWCFMESLRILRNSVFIYRWMDWGICFFLWSIFWVALTTLRSRKYVLLSYTWRCFRSLICICKVLAKAMLIWWSSFCRNSMLVASITRSSWWITAFIIASTCHDLFLLSAWRFSYISILLGFILKNKR